MVATRSLAASSGNTPSGQAVCTFQRMGAWARWPVPGAVYEAGEESDERDDEGGGDSVNRNGI